MKRVLTAAALLLVAWWVVWRSGPWVFAACAALLAAVGALEAGRLAERSGFGLYRWVSVATGAAACLCFADPEGAPRRLLLVLPASLLAAMACALRGASRREGALAAVAGTLFAGLYPGLLLAFLVGLRTAGGDAGRSVVFFLLVVIWAGDIAALYVGTWLGRRLLAPTISPRKTVEGGIASVLAAAAAGVACRHLFFPEAGPAAGLVGALLGAAGVAGDLGESVLKRSAGVKDSSALLPGHGGVLDRIDSLIVAAPLFYAYRQLVLP